MGRSGGAAGELRARRAREEAAAREARLDGLAERRDSAWQEVEDRIATKLPGEYDRAVSLLADLHALADREGERAAFTRPLRELRERHRRKSGLQRRMDEVRPGPVPFPEHRLWEAVVRFHERSR
ncbi:hypothetical protein [Nocardiopsis metallicus]|uniref:hypothetical protein n=1 Tax=Nocardiopsis metallicus TaxID=179819 RepID=UPI0031E131E5